MLHSRPRRAGLAMLCQHVHDLIDDDFNTSRWHSTLGHMTLWKREVRY